jgi:hypothetical protein
LTGKQFVVVVSKGKNEVTPVNRIGKNEGKMGYITGHQRCIIAVIKISGICAVVGHAGGHYSGVFFLQR